MGVFVSRNKLPFCPISTESIDELLTELTNDGPNLPTRRRLSLSQTVHNDFVPTLLTSTAASFPSHSIVPRVVKLLSYLTSPIECLIPNEFSLTEEGTQVVFEVDSLLKSVKSEFADYKVTGCVVEFLKSITNKVKTIIHSVYRVPINSVPTSIENLEYCHWHVCILHFEA